MTQSMTPAQIDTEIANILGRLSEQNKVISAAYIRVHAAVGDTRIARGTSSRWAMTDAQALALLREYVATGRSSMYGPEPDEIIESINLARQACNGLMDLKLVYEKEYERRGGWSRFFLVTSSHGHIHRSMGCQTCTPTTTYSWITGLSGSSEADAVEEHGPLLCSVCFPTAPIEWISGWTSQRCSGCDKPATNVKSLPRTSYGTCAGCGERYTINANGCPRAHKPK